MFILTGYVSPSFNKSKYMPVPSHPEGPVPIYEFNEAFQSFFMSYKQRNFQNL